jgi:hypothetical protein
MTSAKSRAQKIHRHASELDVSAARDPVGYAGFRLVLSIGLPERYDMRVMSSGKSSLMSLRLSALRPLYPCERIVKTRSASIPAIAIRSLRTEWRRMRNRTRVHERHCTWRDLILMRSDLSLRAISIARNYSWLW